MFLSRLLLAEGATGDPEFWRGFSSEYALHRSVWEMFGDHPERVRDFLYRLDHRRKKPVLWTLSRRPPEAPALWAIDSKEMSPDLRPGDVLELAVRVNPVVTRDGKRHDVVMDRKHRTGWREQPRAERETQASLVQTALAEWFRARAERLGVRVLRILAEAYRVERFRKPSGKRIQLGLCDLSGLVEVRDPARFLEVWAAGLGPAKGFGCGLMLIRRGQR